MVTKPPLHGHHKDPVPLVVLDLGGLAYRFLGKDAHPAELAPTREHRVHGAQRHGIEMPVHRGNGGIEESRVPDDVLDTAGDGGVEHPMRVDR